MPHYQIVTEKYYLLYPSIEIEIHQHLRSLSCIKQPQTQKS